ncbi:MAG: dihydrolipoyl dehydrogenase [Candidatus Marinimicrobia bacterium]|nr:dihydrolipoyl dehydrogenase [Candidatus Neomarinimicrobiota bacterium]
MSYDVVIIGGGPGGYVAAIRAAQLGHKALVVEKENLGGICLNWGCIPTKALLKNAEIYENILNASKYGIKAEKVSFDWSKIISRSRNIAKRLSKGIEYLMKKNNIEVINGSAVIKNKNEIMLDSGKVIKANYIIIATGCRAKKFPGLEFDGKRVLNYKDAMSLAELPKTLTIIGAGAIGVEFAYFFNSFGVDVTLVESQNHILPIEDLDISKELEKSFARRKIKIKTSSKINSIKSDKKIILSLEDEELETDALLVAIGVDGNYEEVLGDVDIKVDNGFILTNEFMQTNHRNIYAIGDIAGPPWLAHVASSEGILAVEHLSSVDVEPIECSNVPGCTYCKPEIASIGMTEKEALEKGHNIKVGKFPLSASGKAMAISSTEGFAKIIFDAKYGELLGFHMIGENATEIISEIAVAKSLEATYNEIIKIMHPHPTISELVPEAAANAVDESIHI